MYDIAANSPSLPVEGQSFQGKEVCPGMWGYTGTSKRKEFLTDLMI